MAVLATIGWFLKRVFWFVIDNWKVVLPVVLVLVASIWLYRACSRPPKLDEKAIQKAQQAIAEQDRKAMVEILAESDTKEAEIDSNLKQIELDREAAKKNYTGLSNEQLGAELERRAKE